MTGRPTEDGVYTKREHGTVGFCALDLFQQLGVLVSAGAASRKVSAIGVPNAVDLFQQRHLR